MINLVGLLTSIVLIVELGLVALSALLGLAVWRHRLWEVTGWRVTEPARWLIAAFALATGAMIFVGLGEKPRYAVAGGVLSAVGAGVVLIRRVLVTTPGRGTVSYLLFLLCGVLLAYSTIMFNRQDWNPGALDRAPIEWVAETWDSRTIEVAYRANPTPGCSQVYTLETDDEVTVTAWTVPPGVSGDGRHCPDITATVTRSLVLDAPLEGRSVIDAYRLEKGEDGVVAVRAQ